MRRTDRFQKKSGILRAAVELQIRRPESPDK
jgi:hypothetical protein